MPSVMTSTNKNELYYDSIARGSPPLEELHEVIHYRNLILQLTCRDVMARYKRSVLGIAWTMLKPQKVMVIHPNKCYL